MSKLSVEARQRVEASNRKLIEMDRVKKDFVANICHELRTPVSTIIGFSEVLRESGINGSGGNMSTGWSTTAKSCPI